MKIDIMTLAQQKSYKEAIARSRYSDLEAPLKDLFGKSIGFEHSVTKQQIFSKCFGNPNKYNDFALYFLWNRIVSAMSKMRKLTHYFIVSGKDNTGRIRYHLPIRRSELDRYERRLTAFSKGCDKMILRSKEAVKKRFYKKLD